MGTLRDEELQTQQQIYEGDSDNVYLELAKAITERKCRIVQKKEKIKLIINEVITLNEKFKSAINEEKCRKKDTEEVFIQKTSRVQNIQNAQKSRSTLETTLCDLNNKVAAEKAETKRKKDEYDGAVKDAHETWESYEERYENFPLAKKLRGLVIAVKEGEIAINQAEMDIADFKVKRKSKRDIAERRFHLDVVQLAEKYKLCQEKVREQKELQEKVMKMKNLIADIKSGKATKHQLESSQESTAHSRKEQHVVRPQPELVMFTVPGIQVNSPPPSANESESSRGGKLFDWSNLLGSTGLLGFSKKSAENIEKHMPNTNLTLASTVLSSKTESQKEKTPNFVKKIGSSLKLTNLLGNTSVPQRKPEINIGNKRSHQNETISEANKHERHPCKKVLVVTSQSANSSVAGPPESNNKEINENPPQAMIRKDMAKEYSFDKDKKENTNPRISNTSSDMKPYMYSLVGNNRYRPKVTPASKTMNTNLMNLLSLQGTKKERKDPGSPRKNDHEQAKAIKNVSANSQNASQYDQQRNCNEEDFFQNANSDRQNQHIESIPIMLEPGSPAPDLIPVEANPQLSSQGNIMRTCSPIDFNLSGESDLISPDVDDASKMVYQRIVSQGLYPAQEYSKENAVNSQKPTSEQNVVRSQYFTDPPSLNTPPDGPGDYLSPTEQQPFSPPLIGGEFDNSNQLMNSIPSPPPANAGAFGGSGSAHNTSAFTFTPGSSKNNSNKSFFDLF